MPPVLPTYSAITRQIMRARFLVALEATQPHLQPLAIRAMQSRWCGLLTEFEANELIRIYDKRSRNA